VLPNDRVKGTVVFKGDGFRFVVTPKGEDDITRTSATFKLDPAKKSGNEESRGGRSRLRRANPLVGALTGNKPKLDPNWHGRDSGLETSVAVVKLVDQNGPLRG
jgi:hypothetical protein